MKKFLLIAVILVANVTAEDNVRLGFENGFGARAFSLANNYVALSNDLSAIYWNPAALSFSLTREFQVTFDMSSFNGTSTFSNNQQTTTMNRLKVSNTGFMYSFPATQGGLTIAFSYSNPFVFDDIYKARVNFISDGQQLNIDESFRTSGGLKYFSGGFGLQVAPRVGVGTTVSFVYGREDLERMTYVSNGYSDNSIDYGIKGKYAGHDVRVGAIYKDDLLSAGLRFVFPQVIRVRETDNEKQRIDDTQYKEYSDRYRGKMYSSYNGAAGISLTLPMLTITAEGRAVFPFGFVFPSEEIPNSSQTGYFKLGGGVGVEFPVGRMPMLIRTGYSLDEVDLHRYISKYDREEFIWNDDNFRVDEDRHQISAGVVFFSSNISLDIGYCYSMWEIMENVMHNGVFKGKLKHDYSMHKLMLSLSLRY
jgi:hypothetical protein